MVGRRRSAAARRSGVGLPLSAQRAVGVAVALPAHVDVDTAVNGTVTVSDNGPETATGVVATITVPAASLAIAATPDLAAAAGCAVDLELWDRMPHVWHLYARVIPEARRALARVGEFLQARM